MLSMIRHVIATANARFQPRAMPAALTRVVMPMMTVVGSLDTGSIVPPLGLLGFFIAVIALCVSMLRDRSPAPAAGLASQQATAAHQ
jgi:hypothetical protein